MTCLALSVSSSAQAKAKPKAFNGKTCTIVGTSKNDKLTGTSKADVICGLGGNDTINGAGGSDTIDGGAGIDILSGGAGNDSIDGGAGNDTVNGEAGNDVLTGDAGNDKLNGGLGNDTLQGETGADVFIGGTGVDVAKYSEKIKGLTLDIDNRADDGTAGEKDNIKSDIENIIGGSGNDTITGSSGANTILGGLGNDSISGGLGNDEINSESGNDSVQAGPGDDHIDAGPGTDFVIGGDGDDGLIGGSGKDTLNGDGATPQDNENNLCDPTADGDVVSYCGFDESAPDISAISINRPSVDTSQASQTIVVSAHLTDKLMGVKGYDCRLLNGQEVVSYRVGASRILTGTIRDGFWESHIPLPKWSSQGRWYVECYVSDYSNKQTFVQAQADGSFDYRKYDGSTFAFVTGLGDSYVDQVGLGDLNSPVVDRISVDKSSVNTSSSSQAITITAHITDDLSGINAIDCSLKQNVVGFNSFSDTQVQVSGTIRDGIWKCKVTLPKWSKPGKWYVSFSAWDHTSKVGFGSPSDLYVEQMGAGDEYSPRVDQISVSKTSIDTSSSAQTVTITARITDDLSGVDRFICALTQNGGGYTYSNGRLLSGNSRNGIWTCNWTLPRGASSGKWYLNIGATDSSGKDTFVEAKPDGTFLLTELTEGPPTIVSDLGAGYVTNG